MQFYLKFGLQSLGFTYLSVTCEVTCVVIAMGKVEGNFRIWRVGQTLSTHNSKMSFLLTSGLRDSSHLIGREAIFSPYGRSKVVPINNIVDVAISARTNGRYVGNGINSATLALDWRRVARASKPLKPLTSGMCVLYVALQEGSNLWLGVLYWQGLTISIVFYLHMHCPVTRRFHYFFAIGRRVEKKCLDIMDW